MSGKYNMNGVSGEESNFVNPAYSNSDNDLSKPSSQNRDSPPPEYTIEYPPNATEDKANGSALNDKEKKSEDGDDEKKKKEKPNLVGVGAMFRFATARDKFMMLLGTICGCAHGAGLPIMIIVFGNMTDSFIQDGKIGNLLDVWIPTWVERCQNITEVSTPVTDPCVNVTKDYILDDPDPPKRFLAMCDFLNDPIGCDEIKGSDLEPLDLMAEMRIYAIYFTIIGCCVQVVAYFQVMGWQSAAFDQSSRIRKKLFWSIMRQEIGWFDTHEVGELNTRMSDDTSKIEGGIGEKLGLFCQWVSAFIAGIVIGFVYSWKLTLVTLAVSPLMAIAGGAMGKLGSSLTSKELAAYAKAGAVAEEVFGAIRTVVAFGGEEKECTRYTGNLAEARDFGIKKGMVNGMAMGLVYMVMFGSYGLAFWYGSKLVYEEDLSPGDLMIVFFCVLIGTFSLGTAAPNVQHFANARGAAYAIWGVIDNVPHIDNSSEEGSKDENITGNVEFRNIHFNYPSRPDVKVLDGLSMKVKVGQTVALVGPSGCGKSTTVQLLQRFYDPQVGEVLIDGIDIRERNVTWLRQHIGVVSQEPVLFDTTIVENIRYGQDGVSTDDIIRASKEANAHDFITKLPKQYDTLVGGRGAQLSGGQKQRIAIARALVRNPKILLLDEATSALDTESEATVQGALDKARLGRTTLVIAHRLSTIRTADAIVGVQNGTMTEQGTHDELMDKQGLYYELVMNQQTEEEDVDITDPVKPELNRAVSHSGKLKRGMSTTSYGSELHRAVSTAEEEKLPEVGLGRIMSMNKPETPLLIGGCICAIVSGLVMPAFAIIFAEILGVYALPEEEAKTKVNLYSGMFPVIGVIAGLSMTFQSLCFSRSGEYLTLRLRQMTFRTILRMDVSYFDNHSNNVGALCTRLATDASAVQGATGGRLGMFCQSLSSIGTGIIIGFIYSWELTLLIIGFVPFVLASGFIQMKVLSGNTEDNKVAYEQAGKIAIEGIENIRTVATLTKEAKFYDDYCREMEGPHRKNVRGGHIQGIAYGFSQAVLFFAYAACFYLGAYLIENRGLAFDDLFRVFSALVFGAMAAGEASSFAPDYGKAKASAATIFHLFDTTSPIDHEDTSGDKLHECRGSVEFKNVAFKYPTRPDVTVLQGMDLTVQPGQTVALVGSSGCGKSTSVQLLERFYDPLEGDVCIEGKSLKELNLRWVRGQMGLVSQEPILFDSSIRYNVAYGDNTRDVQMPEIIEAARNANIHNFIESLPEGYDTNVGDKGAQLSGGQKQRIAIARALVRNPKILLLDEATSALDTESEKVVQAALDKAQEGRTCIVIAHRLSTIQNADCILVIHQGHVVEMGTHSELIQQRGRYYKLNNTQLTKN